MRTLSQTTTFLSCLLIAALPQPVEAEGAAQLAPSQTLRRSTLLFVDILDPEVERISFEGTGSVTVHPPNATTGSELMPFTTFAPDVRGPHRLALSSDQADAWDITVVGATDGRGRLHASSWEFSTGSYTQEAATAASFYAVVAGLDGRSSVVELKLDGLSGNRFKVSANTTGIDGPRAGLSVASLGETFVPSAAIYLSPPEVADYTSAKPALTDYGMAAGPLRCNLIVPGQTRASFHFSTDVDGKYELACDTNRDGTFHTADLLLLTGPVRPGVNSIEWDGTGRNGEAIAPGEYDCRVTVQVGEVHFVFDDVESSYPGVRLFLLDAQLGRAALAMSWDDALLPMDGLIMPNGETSLVSSPPQGLDSGPYLSAAVANQNARAWGNFTRTSKGSDALLDTHASVRPSAPGLFRLTSTTDTADRDGDTLSDYVELCNLGTRADAPDSDQDGLRDDRESPNAKAVDTDADGVADAFDTDSDADGVADGVDLVPLDARSCADRDRDGCDDCALTGADRSGGNVANDGSDTERDGVCDLGDEDDDNDGLSDAADLAPLDARSCTDRDQDGCDDCALTAADRSGGNVAGDGPDADRDGQCDVGDADDDNDGVPDAVDRRPLDASACTDRDGDGCDDCARTGANGSGGDPGNDGEDLDHDGLCGSIAMPPVTEEPIPEAEPLRASGGAFCGVTMTSEATFARSAWAAILVLLALRRRTRTITRRAR